MKDEILVDIAVFSYVNDSYVLQSLLESEGIKFYMKNENFTGMLPGVTIAGGATLMVKSSDVEAAGRIMKEGGYEKFLLQKFV